MYELLSGDSLPPRAELTPLHARTYLTEIAAEEMRRNLRIYCRRSWPQLQPQALQWNWHLDAICLPGETLITTETGPLPIGYMVESGWTGNVLSYCHDRGRTQWKPIKTHMRSAPQPLLKIHFADRAPLEITGNHPVFVEGKGYVRADLLKSGQTVLAVRRMRRDFRSNRLAHEEILQSEVLRTAQDQARNRHVSDMRRTKGLGRFDVSKLLFQAKPARQRSAVCRMQQRRLYDARQVGLLAADLRGLLRSSLPEQVLERSEESGLYRRVEHPSLFGRISTDASAGKSARAGTLFPLPHDAATHGRAPHRSRPQQQCHRESSVSVPALSSAPALAQHQEDGAIGRCVITSIEHSLRVCDALYNLEVADNHNYFAAGILVHNCDHLAYVTMGEIRFLMISIGPRTTKTMVCSVQWPTWHWLHVPGEQFLTASVDDQLARDSSILSRRLIESPWYQTQYPGQIELFDDENTAGMYRNRKGGYRMIASVQGRVTGVGGTIQLADDLVDAKKVQSDAVRHSTLAWHDNAWRSRVNNPDHVKKVYVGQRTHEADPYGHVLSQEGDRWVHLVLPTEFNPLKRCVTYLNKGEGVAPGAKPIFQDPRQTEREILDPKRMSAKTVNAEKRIVSEAAWQAQYNQDPIGMGGLILKRHWWRPWVQPEWRANARAERPMPRFDKILQIWDTALGEEEQDDFSACTTWGTFTYTEQYVDKKLHRPPDWPKDKERPVQGETRVCAMLLDAVKERYAYPDLRQKAIDLYKDFDPHEILIEKKVSGFGLVQELRRKRLPIKAVKLTGSSGRGGGEGDLVARAHAASLMLEKGCVWYPVRPFAYAVIDECSGFPNADHDDYVSTVVIALMYLRRYHDLQLPDDEKDEISPWAWKRRPQKRYA